MDSFGLNLFNKSAIIKPSTVKGGHCTSKENMSDRRGLPAADE